MLGVEDEDEGWSGGVGVGEGDGDVVDGREEGVEVEVRAGVFINPVGEGAVGVE